MGATDQMIARYMAEIEERQQFIDGDRRGRRRQRPHRRADRARHRDPQPDREGQPADRAADGGAPDPRRLRRADRGDRASYMHDTSRRRRTRSSTGPPARTSLDNWQAGLGSEEAHERLDAVQPGRRPPDHRRQPRAPAGADRRAGRQLRRRRPPARVRARAAAAARPRPGRGRRSPSTPPSPSSRQRRPSSRRRR